MAIYKPSLLDKFKDFVNGLKSNWDIVETHLADYTSKFPDNAGAHNSIYRGKNLGTSVTAEQYNNIANGTFKDMYIGDYWTINGVNYRIAAFNYYKNTGSTAVTVNHITLVPDTRLYTHVMNDTNTTEGGYVGSKMYEEGLEEAKSIINSAFSGHVLKHKQYLSNAVSDGQADGWAEFDSEVELMNEHMVYGGSVWANGIRETPSYNVGYGKSQLPLFALRPDLIGIRASYWLRDVASAAFFAYVHTHGIAYSASASYALGVRPHFSIS